jgi:hypothetical protein
MKIAPSIVIDSATCQGSKLCANRASPGIELPSPLRSGSQTDVATPVIRQCAPGSALCQIDARFLELCRPPCQIDKLLRASGQTLRPPAASIGTHAVVLAPGLPF